MKKMIPLMMLGLIIALGCGTKDASSQQDVDEQGEAVMDQSEEEVALIKTDFGDIVIEFYEEDAPQHVANFKKLAEEGFYDGTTFHRIIPNFMIQGGDPNSKDEDRMNDGLGGTGYTIPAEIKRYHKRGAVAAARKGDQVNPKRASSGCQFYICVVATRHLNGAYSVFGEVIDGMDVVDEIVAQPRDARDNPKERIEITVQIRNRSDVMGMD